MKCELCKKPEIDGCKTGMIFVDKDGFPCPRSQMHHAETCENILEIKGMEPVKTAHAEISNKYPMDALYYQATLSVPRASLAKDNLGFMEIYEEVRAYRDRILNGTKPLGQSLVIFGSKGRGKSYLAAAICNEVRRSMWKTIFFSETDFLNRLKAAFDSDEEKATDILSDCVESNLFVLDDVGKATSTAWSRENLFHVFDRRYAMQRPCVITSNLAADQLANSDQWGAIVSRLTDKKTGRIIDMAGKNLRT